MLHHFNKILQPLLLCISLFFFTEQAVAQFTITDNFRGSSSPGIIIGDDAKLTSGDEDPVNAGWLRLTSDANDNKGYAYVNSSFPSTLGVLIDFEYIQWRTRADNQYQGADGISIFLFDAQYGPGNFSLGAYGGSLGYANRDQELGVTGGYLGIGLDAYGNFARNSEDKNGGPSDLSPNSIVFRGPTTTNDSITNRYLKGVTILQNGNIVNAMNSAGNATHNVVDYNTVTSQRPTKDQFYRRVLVEIKPTGTGFYNISVSWSTEIGGDLVELMTYQTADVPPELLKVGFAASTGGGFNNHEVRNLMITTPGNLRVVKRADKDILRSVPATNGPSNEIEYHIEVINDTPVELDAIDFTDKLTDANGNPIPVGMFEITSITPKGFLANTTLPNPGAGSPITNGEFDGTLHLAANTTGTITVKGKLNAMPTGNLLINTTSAFPTTILDEDLLNNTSVVETPVVSEESDLVITSEVDESCLVGVGNRFELTVSNIGVLPLTYGSSGSDQLTVSTTLPSGVSISNTSGTGWTHSSSGNQHTFTRTGGGTLNSGQSLPPISYTLTSNGGYTNMAEVSSSGEPVENHHNNTTSRSVNPIPNAPIAEETIYYCLGTTAVPLEAEAAAGNTLRWYLNEGGAVSNRAFTPSTSTVGSTIYYVSQQADGGCESSLTEITVVVLDVPTAGNISPVPEICPNTAPEEIRSNAPGTGSGIISYRWESSTDDGQNWTEIANQNGETFQPTALNEATAFRRITLNTEHNTTCASEPTDPVTVYMSVSSDCAVCTEPVSGEAFQWEFNTGTSSPVTQRMTQPGSNGGFEFDIYELDNSFNMEINGVLLAQHEIEFQSNGTPAPGINIEFEDGDQYETNTIEIWKMRGDAENPMIRVKISPTGEVSMYGSKVSYGELYPLKFKQNISPVNSFNRVSWNATSSNTIIVTQNVVGLTIMDGYGSGRNITPCKTYTLEKKGVFNDENGDGIAQPGETITYSLAVKNAGDIDIYNLKVEDPMLGGEITVTPVGDDNNDGVLNTYETWIYTVDYEVTQQDIKDKGVYNLATVSGENVLDDDLDPETSTDPNPLDPNDPKFDPNRPDHTFVPLKGRTLLITNPNIYQRVKSN